MEDYLEIEISEEEAIEIGKARQGMHPNGARRFFLDPNTEHIIGGQSGVGIFKIVWPIR